MKKLTLVLLAFIAGSTLLFTGCQDPEPTDVKPTISFETGADYTSTDVTVEVGEEMMVGVNADANENSGALLTNLKMVRHFVSLSNEQTSTWDTTISVNTYSIDFIITAFPAEGTETFIFTITDAEGETAEISFDVTTEKTYGPIDIWPDVTLGDQSSSNGSSFASIEGEVYSLADAKENCEKVDFVFYKGATNGLSFCSPDHDDAAAVFNNATNGIITWHKRNHTIFKETDMTETAFDEIIDNDAEIVTYAIEMIEQQINNMDSDSTPFIVAFETEAGKKGLIKVQEFIDDPLLANSISVKITVKVQK